MPLPKGLKMKCKFCKTKIDEPIFDLGNTAISNALIKEEDFHNKEILYPLILYICPKCFLVQIDEQASSKVIFDDEYVYFSSLSLYWLEHVQKYSEQIINRLDLSEKSFVVEIASNDGYLLRNFVSKGIDCLGIEPTKSTAKVAISKGIPTLMDFFDFSLAKRLSNEGKKADLIIANNVLAHVPTINNFVSGFKELLKPEGTITIEFPHVLRMFEKNEFDTIYHEHYFYFSIYSLKIILLEHKLSIYNIDELDTHGGSLRVYVTHVNNRLDIGSDKASVNSILEQEMEAGMGSLRYYKSLQKNAFSIKKYFLNYITRQKSENKTIVAFGAAAKGNTFLNYCGVKSDFIDFVVDETPFKIGKYLPQNKIPIFPFDKILEVRPDIIIILPWNHKEEIVKKLSFVKDWGAIIVVFIPKFEVLNLE